MKSTSTFFIFSFLLTLSIQSLAASSGKVKELVDSYYAEQAVWTVILRQENKTLPLPQQPPESRPPHGNPDCQPNFPQACVEAVCNQISRFDCDDRNELLEITRQCRNVKGECIRTVCGHVSRFDCDDKNELFGVADMCRGLFDVSCIDYVCSRLSRFDCDDLSELREITYQCR